jgi:hypothetical protein
MAGFAAIAHSRLWQQADTPIALRYVRFLG